MDEGTLGVHEIELVVKTSPGLGDGGGVGQHADGALHLGQVAAGHHGGGLVVDAHLEASGAPVHELDGPGKAEETMVNNKFSRYKNTFTIM